MTPREPTPWATGLMVSAMTAALVTVAIYAFGSALATVHPALAVVINLVAVGGAAPTVWRWRTTAVLRWIVYGSIVGVGLGWIGLLALSV